jgi:hypothetical protein
MYPDPNGNYIRFHPNARSEEEKAEELEDTYALSDQKSCVKQY